MSKLFFIKRILNSRVRPAVVAVWLAAVILASLSLIDRRAIADTGTGSVSLTSLGTPVTENFDTLSNTAASTTNTTLPTGWYITEQGGGARDNEQYAVDTGASNTGDTYSYGSTSATDRALGALRSGTLIPFFGAKFTNNTGSTITSLDVTYTGEEWRLGTAARTDQIDFQISTNATDLTTGTYTDVNALDFVTPVTVTTGAKDGNAAANRTLITSTISSLSIPDGATFFIRWTDLDATSADDGLAVDDFSLTPNVGTPTPSLSVNDVTLAEGNSGTTTFTFTVSLSVPALAGGVTFDIATADGVTNPANAGSDYVAKSLTSQTIPQGNTTYTFDVTVNGDTSTEPNETFFVNVTNITGANAGDVQGLGTINNDDVTITQIHTIQGSGSTSPLVSTSVTTNGIVTGLKSNGFFLQTPDVNVDANPETSEGIFVFTSSAPPAAAAIGSSVNVTGTVQEFIPSADPFSPPATELVSPVVVQLSTGNSLPAPILITAAETTQASETSNPLDSLEEYEGMRVTVASLTVSGATQGTITEPSATVSSNGVFIGVVTGVARPFREPGIAISDPLPVGAPATIPRFDENPERIRVDSDAQPGATAIDVAAGTIVTNITGPLDYAFRVYTIDPDVATPPTVGTQPGSIPVPAPTSNELTVASFNLERFFDTVDDPGTSDPILTAAAFNRRVAKASLIIRTVQRYPDVIGVEEMENLSTLQAVANQINTDAVNIDGLPNPNYTAYLVEGNDIGGIDVGFLVKQSRVTVIDVTQFGKTTTYVEPGGATALLNDRPPLVLRATIDRPTGGTFAFTMIVNHLRSLNGVDDPVDGDRVRTKRRAQAEYLANLIQSRQTSDPTEKIITVGDMNAFQVNDGYVDVIGTIKGTPAPPDQVTLASADLVNPDLTDLVDTLSSDQRYSYNFDGNAQVLDHIILNQSAMSFLNRFAYARNDSDFPVKNYESTNELRISDHDQPVAYFNLNTAPTANAQSVTTAENTPVGITLTGSDPESDPLTFTIVSGPAHGTLNPGTTGASQTYTPTSGYTGPDSFTFKVNDGAADSAPATVSITVNEGGTLQFSSATYSVGESGGSATITITRSGGSAGIASVLFSTSNGTAGSGDYTSVSQTVTFNDGDLSKTVDIPITNDALHESSETVNLALGAPGGSGELGSPVAAVLTILDDDPAGGTITFSSSSYTVTEIAGSILITVNRNGDTSQAATVDYATSDVTATERKDYTTALGTLRFEAGETSKAFAVLVNLDSFTEGSELVDLTLSNPTGGAILGVPSSASLQIDNTLNTSANVIDDPQQFVIQHYHDFLNREPDGAGLNFWTNEITNCGSDTGCIEIKRINVSAAFFLSIEFQETGFNAYLTNKAAFNTLPRYLRFEHDTQALQRGYVFTAPGSAAVLEANKVAYFNQFVAGSDFTTIYGSLNNEQYVDALIANTGVTFTASERSALITGLNNSTETRATVLRKITEKANFKQAEFNRAFVLMEYFGYLRRNPDDAPDNNFDGFNFWLNKLNQFNGNFVNADMVKAFIKSAEYRQRFGN